MHLAQAFHATLDYQGVRSSGRLETSSETKGSDGILVNVLSSLEFAVYSYVT